MTRQYGGSKRAGHGAESPPGDAAADPLALAEVLAGLCAGEPEPLSFSMRIAKVSGTSLGIDVAYNSSEKWARKGVFVSQVFEDGLVAIANAGNAEPRRVSPGDFIFQVNEVHGDVVSMVEEMKAKQQLSIHVVRRKTASAAHSPPPEAVAASRGPERTVPPASAPPAPEAELVSMEALLPRLAELEDEALAGLVYVVLQGRPWLRDAVLGSKTEPDKEEEPIGASSEPPKDEEGHDRIDASTLEETNVQAEEGGEQEVSVNPEDENEKDEEWWEAVENEKPDEQEEETVEEVVHGVGTHDEAEAFEKSDHDEKPNAEKKGIEATTKSEKKKAKKDKK